MGGCAPSVDTNTFNQEAGDASSRQLQRAAESADPELQSDVLNGVLPC